MTKPWEFYHSQISKVERQHGKFLPFCFLTKNREHRQIRRAREASYSIVRRPCGGLRAASWEQFACGELARWTGSVSHRASRRTGSVTQSIPTTPATQLARLEQADASLPNSTNAPPYQSSLWPAPPQPVPTPPSAATPPPLWRPRWAPPSSNFGANRSVGVRDRSTRRRLLEVTHTAVLKLSTDLGARAAPVLSGGDASSVSRLRQGVFHKMFIIETG